MTDDLVLLQFIIAACLDIADFTAGGENHFLEDKKTNAAVMQRLLVIGEAVKRVSRGLKARFPDVPWAQAAALRDRLAHDILDIRLDIIWRVASRSMPGMRRSIEAILND